MKKILLLTLLIIIYCSCGNNEVNNQYIQKKYKDYRIINKYTRGRYGDDRYFLICIGDTLKEIEVPDYVYEIYETGDTIGKIHVALSK